MSRAKLGVLTCQSFRHNHDVFQLQIDFEFGLIFGRDAAGFGAFDKVRHALGCNFRRVKRNDSQRFRNQNF